MDLPGQKFTAVAGVIVAVLLLWIVILPWATGLGPPWSDTVNLGPGVGPCTRTSPPPSADCP